MIYKLIVRNFKTWEWSAAHYNRKHHKSQLKDGKKNICMKSK